MRNYKNLYKYYMFILSFIVFFSCEKDDYTNDSMIVPNNTSVNITTPFSSVTLVEDDSEYDIQIGLSTPQVVDVKVYLTKVGGTAIEGNDYEMTSSVIIPAGTTSAKATIKILKDDLIEDTETLKIKIGNDMTANASIQPQTIDFTILNYTEGDLAIDLSWTLTQYTTDTSGNEVSPTSFADLRLLLSESPDNVNVYDGADGSGYETYLLGSSAPDGEYYVVADFYDVNPDPVRDINLKVDFFQSGVINDMSFSFSNALNSSKSCSYIYFVLAKVVKSGNSYSITEIGENSEVIAAPFIGTATVEVDDWADYSEGDNVTIEAGATPYEFWIRSYDNAYISNPDTSYMIVTINPTNGNVTVNSNEYFDYGQPGGGGYIAGTGTVNACTGEIDLILTFDLGGFGNYPDNQFKLIVN